MNLKVFKKQDQVLKKSALEIFGQTPNLN